MDRERAEKEGAQGGEKEGNEARDWPCSKVRSFTVQIRDSEPNDDRGEEEEEEEVGVLETW